MKMYKRNRNNLKKCVLTYMIFKQGLLEFQGCKTKKRTLVLMVEMAIATVRNCASPFFHCNHKCDIISSALSRGDFH